MAWAKVQPRRPVLIDGPNPHPAERIAHSLLVWPYRARPLGAALIVCGPRPRDLLEPCQLATHAGPSTTVLLHWWTILSVMNPNVLLTLADILREELDGAVGTDAESMAAKQHVPAFWTERREEIEAAARAAG
jgi:hypothetical protein